MDKKSFLLYKDISVVLEYLTDDEAGKLFKLIVSYVNCENPDINNHPMKLVFLPIRQQLKRDLEKYNGIVDRNKSNGSKGGRPSKPRKPSGLINNPSKPRKADTDNGNGIDTDIEIDIKQQQQLVGVVVDKDFSDIYKFYEANIGVITPCIMDDIKYQFEHHSCEMIKHAIKTAVRNNKLNWSYVNGILNNWEKNNINSVESAELESSKRKIKPKNDYTSIDAVRAKYGR